MKVKQLPGDIKFGDGVIIHEVFLQAVKFNRDISQTQIGLVNYVSNDGQTIGVFWGTHSELHNEIHLIKVLDHKDFQKLKEFICLLIKQIIK